MRRGLRNRLCRLAHRDFHRQGIRFIRSVEITHLDKPKLRGIGFSGNGGLFEHAHVTKSARFRAEPAAASDVIGKDFAFDSRMR